MSFSLTSGALAKICQGEDVSEPILQVLGHKAIAGSGQERFRLLLNDGEYSNSFSMLATQLNNFVHEDKIPQYSIIKVKKHVCNQMAAQSKRVVIVLELEVLQRGETVGKRIGNPVTIGSDGKVPPTENQNQNPNAGAAAKRPSDSPMGGGPSKVPVQTAQVNTPRSSVLQPRSAGPSAGAPLCTPIASITPYQNKWTMKARVTSKGDIRTWNKPSGSGKLFSMDLMDESGEIRVTAFKEQCDKFYEYAQVGKVYYIANCSVKAANKQYSKLNNDYELTFKDHGSMEIVEEDTSDVPTMVYNFAKISDLATAEKDSMVDVLGICKSAGEETNIVTRAGKELIKREITLVDRSATEVLLTLWGMSATNFDGSGFPVVAVKGVKVSDYNGVTLSGGDILINPDMDLAHELKGWWDNDGSTQTSASITVQGQRGGSDSGVAKTIGEIKQENLGYGSDRGEYYSTTATITFFSKDKALYKACGKEVDGRQCNKKVVENGDGTYRCEKCSEEKPNFVWRLMLQMNMADSTDNTWASCFQETAEKILETKADDLGAMFETEEDRYNAVFTQATFKTFQFRMRVKADTYNDETKLKHTVVDVTEMNWAQNCKKLIQEIESMGGTLPEQVQRSLY
jgi:replication factor A1